MIYLDSMLNTVIVKKLIKENQPFHCQNNITVLTKIVRMKYFYIVLMKLNQKLKYSLIAFYHTSRNENIIITDERYK